MDSEPTNGKLFCVNQQHAKSEAFSGPDGTHDVSNRMPFTIDDKHVIKVLRQEKRYSSRRFLNPYTGWSKNSGTPVLILR